MELVREHFAALRKINPSYVDGSMGFWPVSAADVRTDWRGAANSWAQGNPFSMSRGNQPMFWSDTVSISFPDLVMLGEPADCLACMRPFNYANEGELHLGRAVLRAAIEETVHLFDHITGQPRSMERLGTVDYMRYLNATGAKFDSEAHAMAFMLERRIPFEPFEVARYPAREAYQRWLDGHVMPPERRSFMLELGRGSRLIGGSTSMSVGRDPAELHPVRAELEYRRYRQELADLGVTPGRDVHGQGAMANRSPGGLAIPTPDEVARFGGGRAGAVPDAPMRLVAPTAAEVRRYGRGR